MLIFDFDGVLMDSVREVAVTAYNTLTGDIVTRLNQVPPKGLKLFLRNRFHVQPIGDALVLMKWCLEKRESEPDKLLSAKEYNEILQIVDEPLAGRTGRFFDTRSQFQAKDIKAWLGLNEPVQPVWRLLLEMQRGDLVILTNKNREATITLCRHFGLEISNDNIYSGDKGTTKIDNFNSIMQRFKKSTYAFIDDSVKNLRELDEHFNRHEKLVSLIFAEWGYTGPNDARLAMNLGYQSLTIEEFMGQLQNKF
jgi:FMN phosphatase YigB (HAD superfamily)